MKVIYNDGTVGECPKEEELHVIRHTAAHIMAQAIKRLYPNADFAYGPATEHGFYYDVDLGDTKLSDEDLGRIEKEMQKICRRIFPSSLLFCPERKLKNLWKNVRKNINWNILTIFLRRCHQLLSAGRIH